MFFDIYLRFTSLITTLSKGWDQGGYPGGSITSPSERKRVVCTKAT